jgi:hypothetical protein
MRSVNPAKAKSGSAFRISDLRFQITDFKAQISDSVSDKARFDANVGIPVRARPADRSFH